MEKELTTVNKVVAIIVRPNGAVEKVDLTAKFPSMTEPLFRQIKKATHDAGRGDVQRIEHTYTASNYSKLASEYVNGMLEGGEGYVPDFTKDPRFEMFEHTEVFA